MPLSSASAPPDDAPSDLTGYWRVVKAEGLDAWLKEAGYPWALRRLATDVGSKAVDIIHRVGRKDSGTLRITTVNARGAWTRTLAPGRDIAQRDAEGRPVRTATWWEGGVHKCVHTSDDGRREVESWRSCDAGMMVVRTALRVRGPPLVPAMAGGGAASPAPHGTAAALAAVAAAPPTASGLTSPAGSVAGFPPPPSSLAATAGGGRGGGGGGEDPSSTSGALAGGSAAAAASSAAALAASLAATAGGGDCDRGDRDRGDRPSAAPSLAGGSLSAAPPAAWPLREAVMYWYLELTPVPPGAGAGSSLCRCLLPPAAAARLPTARDQRRVARACHRDTLALQALARDKARWVTPADVFTDARVWPPHGGAGASGPGSVRASGRGSPTGRGGSRSPGRRGAGGAGGSSPPPPPARRTTTEGGEAGGVVGGSAGGGAPPSAARRPSDLLLSTSGRGASVDSADPLNNMLASGSWGSARGRAANRPFASPGGSVGEGDRTPPTGGGGGGGGGGSGLPLAVQHVRGPSGLGGGGLATISSGRLGEASGGSAGAAVAFPPPHAATTTPEAALAHRLAEYVENRSLTAVVAVGGGSALDAWPASAAASEPELFEMSPAQAEDTQLKLDALREAVARSCRHRRALARGVDVLGCCTVTLNAAAVPGYVRAAWEI